MAGRVQVQDIQDHVPLQSGPLPGSTYVQPGVDPLLRLSQALGPMSNALSNFGEAYIADKRKKDLTEVQAVVPLMSNKEVGEAYRSNKLPGMSAPESIADVASRKLAGARVAFEAQEAMKAELAQGKFDWERDDINKFVFDRMQGTAKQFSGDKYALAGFNETMGGFPQKLGELRTKQATALDQTKREDNTFQAISLAVDKSLADGKSPQDTFTAARNALIATAGPKGSQGVPFADADKYMIQKASQMVADGKNLDHAVAILASERTAEDGTSLPALKDTASHQEAVRSIIRAATTERRKQANLAAVQAITASDANMLSSESGKLATVGDITVQKEDGHGGFVPHVISASDRQKKAVSAYVQEVSPAIAQGNRETPTQTFNRELSNLSFAGADHPIWKSKLDAAPLSASLNELTNPKKRDAFLASANLYDQLREKNPLYLKGLVDGKTIKFFEAYRVAKQLPGKTMEEAGDMARRAAIDISPDQEDTLKGHYREIEQTVSSASPTSGFWQAIFGSGVPVNAGYVQQQVIDNAKLFSRLGLAPQRAIEEAQKAVKETSIKINGWVMPKLATQMPGDFPKAVGSYIEDFVKAHGKLNDGVDKGDVGVAYDGAGAFTLVGPNGVGLRTPQGIAHFTLKDLSTLATNKDDQLREDIRTAGEQRRQSDDDFQKRTGSWAPHMLLRNLFKSSGKSPETDAAIADYANATSKFFDYEHLRQRRSR